MFGEEYKLWSFSFIICTANIIRVIKPRRMRWKGHASVRLAFLSSVHR
jgi:hypothetical protein